MKTVELVAHGGSSVRKLVMGKGGSRPLISVLSGSWLPFGGKKPMDLSAVLRPCNTGADWQGLSALLSAQEARLQELRLIEQGKLPASPPAQQQS